MKLKVHTQNVHEIEKIRYESINDIMEMINTFRNLQNSNVKFVKKKLLKNKFLKCILKMSIKNLKNTTVMSVQKFHQKYFAKGFKLKVHIQNVHEIEKIRYESINDIMEMIITFKNLQNSNVKFERKKLLKNKFLKCILKMFIKNLKNTTVMSVQKFHTKYWIERTYYSCS